MDLITKAGQVTARVISDADLSLINRQSLKVLTADGVFVFRMVACNNQVDRDHERFTERTLADLAKLYVGKTVITDHMWSASGQVARIYAADVEREGEVSSLVLRVYMLKTEQTAPLIAAIEGGIVREVSVGCRCQKALCSICGANKALEACVHRPGLAYDGKQCHVDLDGAEDAYEASFVAVPAQPKAGVIKNYGGEGKPPDPTANELEDEAFLLAQAMQAQEEKRYGGM